VEALIRARGALVVLVVQLLGALAVGCGGSDGPAGPPPKDQLTVVSGGGGSDTIQARLAQVLVVEVRVQGAPRAGVVVQFASMPPTDPTRNLEKTALLGRVGDDQFTPSFSAPTDADGRARVRVALGTVSGEARVAVTANELGLSDTARYTVQAGAAARLLVPVRDTALLGNARYSLGAWALDRFENRRPEAPTFTVLNDLGAIDAAGNVQLSATVGRGRIEIRSGSRVDTAGFVIVPPDLITVTRDAVMTIRLDGSNRVVWQAPGSVTAGVLSPKGDVMAFWEGDFQGSSIYLVTQTGTSRRLVQPSQLTYAFSPRFSHDGAWIYFHSFSIWRIRPDGSQLERVADPDSGSLYGFREPSVSPDGRTIAFMDGDHQTLLTRDLATGQQRTLAQVFGRSPVFSPDGSRVAYDAGSGVGMFDANGNGGRYFACPASGCNGVGWTKDGQWLLTQAFDWVAMVNVTSGEWVIIPGTRGSYSISVQE
jgi:WD40 repeat protein